MKLRLIATLALAIGVGQAGAEGLSNTGIQVGASDYVFASDLAREGFEPFAVSSTAKASFGMKKGMDMYLCFLMDRPEWVAARQAALRAILEDVDAPRTVPNALSPCILLQ